ncbi:helix-turn-helix transcriptional regulator [Phycicoccus avicenniae]|uniref:helix-turn-helix transcriptional regulator n=1 Tax=Phycicoccus avicenniae TaxID=2828860 RepID=UPI003D27AF5D
MKRYTAGPCDTCGYVAGPSKTQPLAEHGFRIHSCAKRLARKASAARGRARDAAVDRTPKRCEHPQAQHEHGTHACYVLDRCRCRPCAAANARYEQQRARRHAYGRFDTYVDAQPARDHVRRLMDAGVGLKRIAEVAGVSQSALGKLIYGAKGRPATARATRPVADKILAVRLTLDTYAPGARVPNVGTKRRLQALMAGGWSQTRLAEQIGMEVRNFNHLLHGKRAVTARTARAVADLYDHLWDQAPPATSRWTAGGITRSRGYALEHGFAPAVAWDDDTIDDPSATPDLGETGPKRAGRPVEHVIEDIEFLLDLEPLATAEQIAQRLRYRDRSAVQNLLARAERRDLLDVLARNASLITGSDSRRTA